MTDKRRKLIIVKTLDEMKIMSELIPTALVGWIGTDFHTTYNAFIHTEGATLIITGNNATGFRVPDDTILLVNPKLTNKEYVQAVGRQYRAGQPTPIVETVALSMMSTAEAELAELKKSCVLEKTLSKVRAIIADGAHTGFNPKDGDWAERLFNSQKTTSAALRRAAKLDTHLPLLGDIDPTEAMVWYEEQISSLARFFLEDKDTELQSVVTELALDAGRRARGAIADVASISDDAEFKRRWDAAMTKLREDVDALSKALVASARRTEEQLKIIRENNDNGPCK